MKSSTVEIYAELRRETENAYLFSDGVSEFWLPKSQIETTHIKGRDYEIEMPEWLAIQKGII